ncbi:hybrid sensor histidine kinase/response regulator [Spartinivicinus poritis]|uniref:histidine kinase n=1 Tax=Spartinivicinus poritis TaxID=2994640 RepID=A0ABT5UFB5_9GAMM|nr:hybrid sensor histidine kinase/response regulator [Spartinivicinus sp. A2-2]MDE1464671.1 hybrid sensor histidine kinase/response regulator [Spartinivicinus sp. A2-2]
MPLDKDLIQRLLVTFAIELEEQCQIITDKLLFTEQNPCNEEELNNNYNIIFRAAHNIKGAATGIELQELADIAHHIESIISQLKENKQPPQSDTIDLFLKSLDGMKNILSAKQQNTDIADNITPLIEQLTQHNVSADALLTNPEASQPTEETDRPLPEELPATLQPEPALIEKLTNSITKNSATSSIFKKNEIVKINLDKLTKIDALSEELQVTKIEMENNLVLLNNFQVIVRDFLSVWKKAQPAWCRMATEKLPVEISQLLCDGNKTISLINNITSALYKNFRSTSNQLGVLSTALQSNVRIMRLVPAATLFTPLTRTVRDIAKELGKEVNLSVTGDDIEIDRSVLEGIHDPVVHLLRNAIDHGIELPANRVNNGKPKAGQLTVTIQSHGSEIIIVIKDDGTGLNVTKIASVALKNKIISEKALEKLNDDEIIDLIFCPGFSTKETVTKISGRGVGLDIVRENIKNLKGNILVSTEEAKGTSFTLHLPVTLATEHGLLIRTSETIFAIPTTAVERVREIDQHQIIQVEACLAILYENKAVPLRKLTTILNLPEKNSAQDDNHYSVVIIAKGWSMVALMVDEVIGEREIIIKPLQPPLISVKNIIGGAFMGSGNIVMVLNPADLVDSALSSIIHISHITKPNIQEKKKQARILVVDDSITTRTLEQNILESVGYKVSVTVDGLQAWKLLQQESFDLIVADIQMPEMDGFQLTEKIKSNEKYASIPVIIVSSLANEEDQRRGLAVGADAYIVKGQFETKILLETVSRVLTTYGYQAA